MAEERKQPDDCRKTFDACGTRVLLCALPLAHQAILTTRQWRRQLAQACDRCHPKPPAEAKELW